MQVAFGASSGLDSCNALPLLPTSFVSAVENPEVIETATMAAIVPSMFRAVGGLIV